jgi:hypothetical protein
LKLPKFIIREWKVFELKINFLQVKVNVCKTLFCTTIKKRFDKKPRKIFTKIRRFLPSADVFENNFFWYLLNLDLKGFDNNDEGFLFVVYFFLNISLEIYKWESKNEIERRPNDDRSLFNNTFYPLIFQCSFLVSLKSLKFTLRGFILRIN